MRKGTSELIAILGLMTTIASYQFHEVPKLEKANQALERQAKAEQEHTGSLQKQVSQLQKSLETQAKQNQALQNALNDTKRKLAEKQHAPVSSRSLGTVRELTGFQVTWYNTSGITKSGKHTEDGLTAASDPSVIPTGTWIEIDMPDGRVLKRRCDDTGGAVHGRILDVYTDASDSEVAQLGRTRHVTVKILNK